jgi:hypothetical protein
MLFDSLGGSLRFEEYCRSVVLVVWKRKKEELEEWRRHDIF